MQPEQTNSDTAPAVVAVPVQAVQTPVQPELEIHTKRIPKQRHFLILFFFSFMWGTFGVDRMYMGLYGTGILKLLTLGGLGFWTLSDFIIIMTGTFRDKQGRLALEADQYKKFASRTVFWFTIILAITILLSGIELIVSVTSLIGSLQNGGSSSIPGLNQLTGGNQSQINSLLNQ